MTNLDKFGKYLVKSEKLADEMLSNGFYNIFLLIGKTEIPTNETESTTPSTYIKGW